MSKIISIPVEKSVPASIAKWLCANFADSNIPAYFGNSLVVVPTKSAIRNLRTEMLKILSQNGVNALSGMRITTLENLITQITISVNSATLPDRLSAWLQAIQSFKSSTIFSNGKPTRNTCLMVAKELEHLKSLLAEKPASFSDIYNIIKNLPTSNFYEISLWGELEKLEMLYTHFLGEKKCKYKVLIDGIKNIKTSYSKIAIAGNINVPQSLKLLLENLQKTAETYILIATNASVKDFDEIGRPRPEVYTTKPINITQDNTFTFASVEDEAQCVAQIAQAYAPKIKQTLSISCEQTQNADIFKEKMAKLGISADIPEARKLSQSMLYKLIKACASCVENDSFARFFEVLVNPLMSQYISQKTAISQYELKNQADILRETYIPQTSQALLTILAEHSNTEYLEAYTIVRNSIYSILSTDLNEVVNTLQDILSTTEPMLGSLAKFEFEALDSVKNCAKEIEQANFNFLQSEIAEMLLNSLEKPSSESTSTPDTIPLNNWIEIFWSNKPNLLLCDMNDGIVPLMESENQFLTDSLRQRLNISNSQQRRARDAYMLETLLSTRSNNVQILYSLKDLSQSPTIPSRILMQAEDSQIASRVKHLFTEPQIDKLELSAPTLLPLKIKEQLPEGFKMSASKFNTYLNSPIEFYVNYILKAQEVSPEKTELDALQYGSIFHEVMRSFAISKYKNSKDPQEIFMYMDSCAKAYEHREYGTALSAEVRIQLHAMRQKLAAVAEVQAKWASEGWQIFETPERKFNIEINSMQITGSIDRVDYNKDLDKFMVIDYKTYSKSKKNITREKHFKNLDENGFPNWLNLQMPLYVMALNEQLNVKSQCAFFVSPNDTATTMIDIWDISDTELKSAEEKIREIINSIKANIFIGDQPPQYDICPNTFVLKKKTFDKLIRMEKIKTC